MKLSDTLDLGARIRALWPHGVLDDATIKEWHLACLAQPQMQRVDVNEAIDRLAVRLSFPPTLDELVNETTAVWEEHKASENTAKQIPPPAPDPEWRARWFALVERMLLAADDDPVRHLFKTWLRRTFTPDDPVRSSVGVPFSSWRSPRAGELLDEMEEAAQAQPQWQRSGRAPAMPDMLAIIERKSASA